MCGRFTSTTKADDLARFFDAASPVDELDIRYNIAPTARIYAVTATTNDRSIESMRWGLLPHWAKTQTGRPLFNARAETLATKNAFSQSFKQRRCLIPVDGYYEWTRNVDGTKQPHYITHRDGDPLAFAGIWRTWHQPDTDTTLDTCAIITCEPNNTMAEIHDRMPVILPPTSWPEWLNPDTGTNETTAMLNPAPNDLLTVNPVTSEVNSARNDYQTLIEPTSQL